MMKTGRAGWMGIGVVTALLLAILLTLYLRTRHAEEREHQEHVSALRLVGQLDAQAELDVLKLRTGLAVDYDMLTSAVDRTTQLVQKVCDHLASEVHDDSAFLDTRCAALHLILMQKAALVERFKSAHSVLHNSLSFLPTAAAEAHHRLSRRWILAHGGGHSTATALQAAGAVDELLLRTLLFAQHATADQADALAHVPRVCWKDSRRNLPDETRDHALTFSAHARVILREQLNVDGLLAQIASLPSNQVMDEISNALLDRAAGGHRPCRTRSFLSAHADLGAGGVTALCGDAPDPQHRRDPAEQRAAGDLRSRARSPRRRSRGRAARERGEHGAARTLRLADRPAEPPPLPGPPA